MKTDNYRKTVLNNGIRIITETIPGRTVSLGIWINTGSRNENSQSNGCSHFVEHMLFKGTPTRTSRQISRQLDALGGASNAFTSREHTCLYATVLDSQLPTLTSICSDLFLNSTFDAKELDRERLVILQEIDMVEDTPEDLIHDLFNSLFWGEHPLGLTVLGSKEVVGGMTSTRLMEYMSQHYTPDRIVVAAAGNLDHEQFVDMVGEHFSVLSPQESSPGPKAAPELKPPSSKIFQRDLEQAHVIMGTYGLPLTSEQRYSLTLLNILLGGNMSSQLFQEIREKRGLAYSVYSFGDCLSDTGQLGIYAGVNPDNVKPTIELIQSIVRQLAEAGVSSDELERAKGYARAAMYLSAESMDSRMLRLARNEYGFGRFLPFAEAEEGIAQVSLDDMKGLAHTLFNDQMSMVVLGPISEL